MCVCVCVCVCPGKFTELSFSFYYMGPRDQIKVRVVVPHTCIPITLDGRGRQISESNMVYRVSYKTARAIQRIPVWGRETKNKKKMVFKAECGDTYLQSLHSGGRSRGWRDG